MTRATSYRYVDSGNLERPISPMNDRLVPRGESLRRAIRWIGERGRHDAATLEEAARQFDLTPLEEQFLLDHFGMSASGGTDGVPDR